MKTYRVFKAEYTDGAWYTVAISQAEIDNEGLDSVKDYFVEADHIVSLKQLGIVYLDGDIRAEDEFEEYMTLNKSVRFR